MFSDHLLNERANRLLDALKSANCGGWVSLDQLSGTIGEIKDGDADLMMLMAGQGVIQARKSGDAYEYRASSQHQIPNLQ
jgi:hypothetical protein